MAASGISTAAAKAPVRAPRCSAPAARPPFAQGTAPKLLAGTAREAVLVTGSMKGLTKCAVARGGAGGWC